MECCLRLSYKLPIKKLEARTQKEKEVVQKQKSEIPKIFHDQPGLVIDMPKQPGYGTLNDRNTARFFQLAETSMEIFRLKTKMVKNLYIIICTLPSRLNINIASFRSF